MRLKPRNTQFNPMGLLFKRYTDLNKASLVSTIIKTSADNYLWQFDSNSKSFFSVEITATPTIVVGSEVVKFTDTDGTTTYYQYSSTTHTFSVVTGVSVGTQITVGTIASKYQVNQYFYTGSFHYVIKGAISENTTQPIKGLIVPLENMTIQHFNDYIDMKKDDFVVIKNKLYQIESVDIDHKHQPKDFTIYTAILNSIL